MKRTFVAVVQPYDRSSVIESRVRLLRADSVVEVIKRLVANNDLSDSFAEEIDTFTDEKLIEAIEVYNGDGTDLLILDEFTEFDPDESGQGKRLIGPE